jgi:hypothetical protein
LIIAEKNSQYCIRIDGRRHTAGTPQTSLIDYYLEILFGNSCKNIMSLFDDGDGFGFLHNHRGEEETDSSSSSSEEEREVEEDEQPCTHFGIINSFEEPQSPAIAALDSPVESQEGQETEDCDNR